MSATVRHYFHTIKPSSAVPELRPVLLEVPSNDDMATRPTGRLDIDIVTRLISLNFLTG